MISIEKKSQADISAELCERIRSRRKEQGFTQAELADKSGVSLGSLKRFERTNEISLASFIKLAMALGYDSDFDKLLSRRAYRSIDEVIADARSTDR